MEILANLKKSSKNFPPHFPKWNFFLDETFLKQAKVEQQSKDYFYATLTLGISQDNFLRPQTHIKRSEELKIPINDFNMCI